MPSSIEDLSFPACCAHCPHQQPLTASCEHKLKQSIIQELNEARSCPVYTEEKTVAMQDLSTSLQAE